MTEFTPEAMAGVLFLLLLAGACCGGWLAAIAPKRRRSASHGRARQSWHHADQHTADPEERRARHSGRGLHAVRVASVSRVQRRWDQDRASLCRGGVSESHQRVKEIDQGTLTLTTKRLIFDETHENRCSYRRFCRSARGPTPSRSAPRAGQRAQIYTVANPLIWAAGVQALAADEFSERK